MTTQITITYGNGIGAEIMEAALLIMREAGANLDIEILQMGDEEYRLGAVGGYDKRTLRSIQRARILLKAPTINPAQIEELFDQELTPASQALYADFALETHECSYIHADLPEFTAISSINEHVAIFETALAADAPNANPAGIILAATHMLKHIGQNEVAEHIGMALLAALEAGAKANNCAAFAESVVGALAKI